MQVAEICGGGKGRLLGIEPLVDPRIDTKTVAACRRRHELPETDRAGLRNGHRIEPALDHGRKGQFFGKAAAPQNFPDHPEVALRSRQPGPHDRPVRSGETLEEISDLRRHHHGIGRQVGVNGHRRRGEVTRSPSAWVGGGQTEGRLGRGTTLRHCRFTRQIGAADGFGSGWRRERAARAW